jgi:hypothetical protein
MRNIKDNLDLAQLKQAAQGFIFNARTDGPKLHRAECDTVGAMHPGSYQKTFFETYGEAVQFLDQKYGARGWLMCGVCSPYGD